MSVWIWKKKITDKESRDSIKEELIVLSQKYVRLNEGDVIKNNLVLAAAGKSIRYFWKNIIYMCAS